KDRQLSWPFVAFQSDYLPGLQARLGRAARSDHQAGACEAGATGHVGAEEPFSIRASQDLCRFEIAGASDSDLCLRQHDPGPVYVDRGRIRTSRRVRQARGSVAYLRQATFGLLLGDREEPHEEDAEADREPDCGWCGGPTRRGGPAAADDG